MTTAPVAAPLKGITVLVTRPQDSALSRVLRRAGARVVWQPAIRIDQDIPTPELDEALRRVDGFDWIVFTSVHGVSSFWRRARALQIDGERISAARLAAVGPATAGAMQRRGARPILGDGLRRLGARVTEATAYATLRSSAIRKLPAVFESGVHCVVFCSPSAVQAVLPYRALLAGSAIACIGPTTAAAATAAGLSAQIVPPNATAASLADAVIEHFQSNVPAEGIAL